MLKHIIRLLSWKKKYLFTSRWLFHKMSQIYFRGWNSIVTDKKRKTYFEISFLLSILVILGLTGIFVGAAFLVPGFRVPVRPVPEVFFFVVKADTAWLLEALLEEAPLFLGPVPGPDAFFPFILALFEELPILLFAAARRKSSIFLLVGDWGLFIGGRGLERDLDSEEDLKIDKVSLDVIHRFVTH